MTSTGNAVGMEASPEAGMHNKNSAVEAIGRLEADLRNRNLYREDEFFVLKVREDDLRALLADHHAQAESLRHSVEREAGLREALGGFLFWADQKCPCWNDEPNPCPLCGASIENLEGCKAADQTLPRHLLVEARAALDRRAGT